jgi:hypothetical protein
MPSQLLSLPSQTSGVGSTQPSHTKPCLPRQIMRPGLAGAAGRVDLRLGQPVQRHVCRSREVAVVDDAVAVVVDAVAGLGLRHAGRVADQLAVHADERAGRAGAQAVAALLADAGQRALVGPGRCSCRRCRCTPRAAASPSARRRRSPPCRAAGEDAAAAAGADAVVEAGLADVEALRRCRRRSRCRGRRTARSAPRSRRAGRRRWGQAFVDLAVAVVVHAVAGLDRAVARGAAVLGRHVVRDRSCCPARS